MDGVRPLALITGAGRATGIGVEVARQLGRRGHHVILTARTAADAQARAEELTTAGLAAEGHGMDITDPDAIAKVAALLDERFGRLDVLINNAATLGSYDETASTADLAEVRANFESTLFGAWSVAQIFLPLLRNSPHGRLVNVSSGAGSHSDPEFGLATAAPMPASYSVAKAALNALTVKLARENPSLRVNAVCPGFTATFDGGAAMGARPVAEGAAGVVWAALLGDDGPTGGFFRDGRPLGW
ncbi:short-chain dehydrogenase [Bradyrhizobium sp. SSBR45G]|uniref:SDR family NAD(P)-dependent oxidoreductase n=1 Tax=unclassified Bradyrhizobium TaxID=2631580 RepID=UPI0023429187|nr:MULTISPECIES: SDR family NAD(P)-dependent oxidoreductase [unclassified Bradyrhizobium]GLH77877.1 short-chain dehydrogenase [Bradyrhizobium sp. SSBR45G]GLH85502.1 short-chain dehydrogenase [Bradyrhizobium sp. SSBR45R]